MARTVNPFREACIASIANMSLVALAHFVLLEWSEPSTAARASLRKLQTDPNDQAIADFLVDSRAWKGRVATAVRAELRKRIAWVKP